jgi:hypothetical protein
MMSEFTPLNPDYASVVAASFARQGLMQALGIELAEVGPAIASWSPATTPTSCNSTAISTAR